MSVNDLAVVIIVFGVVGYILFLDLRRLVMATKAELEAKIQEVAGALDAGFTSLNDTLQAEIQQVIDAINAGQDTASSIALLDALKTSLNDKVATLQSGISGIVTPPAPPAPPAPTE